MAPSRDKSAEAPERRASALSLTDVFIDDVTWGCATRARRAEWQQTITELLNDSRCEQQLAPGEPAAASLRAYVTVEPTALRVAFHDERGDERGLIELSRGVIAPVFREYFSLLTAISSMGIGAYSPQVEALDIARKLMHNDAADLIIRHSTRIVPDHRTARHLFTLFLLVTHDTTKLQSLA